MPGLIDTIRSWFSSDEHEPSAPSPVRARPEEVLNRHSGELMRMRGVLSVGVGRDDAGRPIIIIGLDGERPETQAALPATLDGVPVQVNTSGRISSR
jgi:hypothetical protein